MSETNPDQVVMIQLLVPTTSLALLVPLAEMIPLLRLFNHPRILLQLGVPSVSSESYISGTMALASTMVIYTRPVILVMQKSSMASDKDELHSAL
jgi:hypothetical protein